MPSRDLLVSPDHAIPVRCLPVHAGALVNGAFIVRDSDVPLLLSYFHFKPDPRDLMVAEITATECFLEIVSDMRLNNFPEHAVLPRTGPTIEMDLPRVETAQQLPASIKGLLGSRASVAHADWKIAA